MEKYKGFEIKQTNQQWLDVDGWKPLYKISHPQIVWSPQFHFPEEAKMYIDNMIDLED